MNEERKQTEMNKINEKNKKKKKKRKKKKKGENNEIKRSVKHAWQPCYSWENGDNKKRFQP